MQADLTEWNSIIVSPPDHAVRRGRRPLNGVRAMTGAERVRRYRELRNAKRPKRVLPAIRPELLPGPLTAQIAKDSFVRRLIDASFPQLSSISRECNRKLRDQGLVALPKVHEVGVVAMLAGTAIDYRLRAYFCRDVHRVTIVRRGQLFFERLSKKGDCLDALFNSFEKFVARIKPERRKLGPRTEDKLCRFCILFAYLDWIGRAPLGNSAIEVLTSIVARNPAKPLKRIDAALVVDVVTLSRKFYEKHQAMITKGRKAVVGGTLTGSADIGGADFDLLANGCLVDFKATRQPKITTQQLRQMAGYWLLDYDDKLQIRSIAISLLRHGHTEYFDVESDLRPAGAARALRSTFRSELARARDHGGEIP